MKFLCPSCKAKYQIADDKVAGRSVRMKCRKCGHMISIAKAVTEGSASRRLDSLGSSPPPASAPPPASTRPPAAASPSPPWTANRPPAAPTKPAVPARPAPTKSGGWREPGAPGPSAPARPAPPPRPGAAARPAPPKPAPRGASSPFAAPAPARAQASEPKAESPAPPASAKNPLRSAVRATAPAEPALAPSNGNGKSGAAHAFGGFGAEAGLSHYDAEEDEQTVIASSGALSSAFSHAVHAPESTSSVITAPSDEWYVGINGVPVGPIRLSELRSKATAGAIGLDSLVWREGFEEWLPLRTFPELIAIVEEGMSSARASLTPLSPTASHTPPVATAAAAAALAAPASPFGAPAPTAAVGVLSDPFALPPPSNAAMSGAPIVVERAPLSELVPVIPRKGTGAAAWIAVVVALLFGLTIGFVLFSRDKGEPVVKIVEVPAKTDPKPTESGAAAASGEPEAIEVAGEPGKPVRGTGTLPAKQPDKVPEKTGGLSGLKGLSAGAEGPAGGSAPTEPVGGAGGQLDSGQVQKVVSRYTASVKRSCWQPALDTRAADAPTSARVAVQITVGPSGSVSGVTTSGDPKGYRGLASCISSRVRGWQFPASSGTTTVNVPFFFAAQ